MDFFSGTDNLFFIAWNLSLPWLTAEKNIFEVSFILLYTLNNSNIWGGMYKLHASLPDGYLMTFKYCNTNIQEISALFCQVWLCGRIADKNHIQSCYMAAKNKQTVCILEPSQKTMLISTLQLLPGHHPVICLDTSVASGQRIQIHDPPFPFKKISSIRVGKECCLCP